MPFLTQEEIYNIIINTNCNLSSAEKLLAKIEPLEALYFIKESKPDDPKSIPLSQICFRYSAVVGILFDKLQIASTLVAADSEEKKCIENFNRLLVSGLYGFLSLQGLEYIFNILGQAALEEYVTNVTGISNSKKFDRLDKSRIVYIVKVSLPFLVHHISRHS